MVQNNALLAGASVLVVEDEFLIAMDIEQTLRDLGATHVHLAGTVADGLAILAVSQPTLAVLDLGLGSETSVAVADALAARGVPIIFATGYSYGHGIPAAHAAMPVVEKPIDADRLEDAIVHVLSSASP